MNKFIKLFSILCVFSIVINVDAIIKKSTSRDTIGYLVKYRSTYDAGLLPLVGNDTYTVSLLHFDIDLSDTATNGTHSWSAAGDAAVSDTQKVFGAKSCHFDGTGDYIYTADSADYDFGTGDFTIDFRVYFATTVGNEALVSKLEAAGTVYWEIAMYTNYIYFVCNNGANTNNFSWTPTANTWYHFEIGRSGNNIKAFVNGTQIGSTYDATGLSVNGGAGNLLVGYEKTSGTAYPFNGYIDELRITKGFCRHTSNFTIPTEAYGPN